MGILIDRDDCLIPYTGRNGKDATFDITSIEPGNLFDPASKWHFAKVKHDKGAVPITWLLFKGDLWEPPSASHPFEGPWQTVENVTFALDLVNPGSSLVHRVLGGLFPHSSSATGTTY